jgi:hypothetical protein
MNNNYAKIWHYEDAPQEYLDLYDCDGDEDWLIFIPDGYPGKEEMPEIVDRLSRWGHWETDVEGGTIYVTSHS